MAIKKHSVVCSIILCILLIISIVLAVGIGPVTIDFFSVWKIVLHNISQYIGLEHLISIEEMKNSTQNIVWFLRVPRVLLGGLVGAGLTLSGICMQAFTKNPLAEPLSLIHI